MKKKRVTDRGKRIEVVERGRAREREREREKERERERERERETEDVNKIFFNDQFFFRLYNRGQKEGSREWGKNKLLRAHISSKRYFISLRARIAATFALFTFIHESSIHFFETSFYHCVVEAKLERERERKEKKRVGWHAGSIELLVDAGDKKS